MPSVKWGDPECRPHGLACAGRAWPSIWPSRVPPALPLFTRLGIPSGWHLASPPPPAPCPSHGEQRDSMTWDEAALSPVGTAHPLPRSPGEGGGGGPTPTASTSGLAVPGAPLGAASLCTASPPFLFLLQHTCAGSQFPGSPLGRQLICPKSWAPLRICIRKPFVRDGRL